MDVFLCKICSLTMGEGGRLPKILRCGHSLCSHCATRLMKKDTIVCPLCNLTFFVQSADEIPLNHLVNTILQSSYAEKLKVIAGFIENSDDQESQTEKSESKNDKPAIGSLINTPSEWEQIQFLKETGALPRHQAVAEACISQVSTGSDHQQIIEPDKTQLPEEPHQSKVFSKNVFSEKTSNLYVHQGAKFNFKGTSEEPGLSKHNSNASQLCHKTKKLEVLKGSKPLQTSEHTKTQGSSGQCPPENTEDPNQPPNKKGNDILGTPEEPEYHAGKCEDHERYKTFFCIRCIEWICFSCLKIHHPKNICFTTTLHQGCEIMRHLETEEISKILGEFEEDVHFLRHKNRTIRKLVCKFRMQILELRILLNHCENAENMLVKEVYKMDSTIADGLESVFMLLAAQRILLDDAYAEQIIGKKRSVNDYKRMRQHWFGPSDFENSVKIQHAMELQKALESSFGVFKGFQKSFLHGNFSFDPPEEAREKMTALATQILRGSRKTAAHKAEENSAASATGGTTETDTATGGPTETASATGDTTDTASATGETTDTASATGETTDTASATGETTETASATGDTTETASATGDTAETASATGDTAETGSATGGTAGTASATGGTAGPGSATGGTAGPGSATGGTAGPGSATGGTAGPGSATGGTAGPGSATGGTAGPGSATEAPQE